MNDVFVILMLLMFLCADFVLMIRFIQKKCAFLWVDRFFALSLGIGFALLPCYGIYANTFSWKCIIGLLGGMVSYSAILFSVSEKEDSISR